MLCYRNYGFLSIGTYISSALNEEGNLTTAGLDFIFGPEGVQVQSDEQFRKMIYSSFPTDRTFNITLLVSGMCYLHLEEGSVNYWMRQMIFNNACLTMLIIF